MPSRKLAAGPAKTISRALPDRLGEEADLALLGGHVLGAFGDAGAGAVGIAMELHVTAERDPGEPPACPLAIGVGGDLGTEADGEGVDLHPAPAAHEKVPELMEEDHDGEDEDEGSEVAQQSPRVLKNLHLDLPVAPTCGTAAWL